MEWMNRWCGYLGESKMVPYGCQKTKHQVHRNAFMKKTPTSQGGGKRPMMRIKVTTEYECQVKNEAGQSQKPLTPEPDVKEVAFKKYERKRVLPAGMEELTQTAKGITESTKGGIMGGRILRIRIGKKRRKTRDSESKY